MKGKKRKPTKPAAAQKSKLVQEATPGPPPPPKKAEPRPAAPMRTIDEMITDRMWFILAGVVTLIGFIFRFVSLELRPFHHDEGVNGFFLRTLVIDGVYKYDPANYHGPTLYYISLAFAKVFGLETIPMRVSTAIFGFAMFVLVLFLRGYIGNAGSLIAALFVALSPGMTFVSRYFIHEIFFVFLSITLVLAVIFFIEKRKAGPFAIG